MGKLRYSVATGRVAVALGVESRSLSKDNIPGETVLERSNYVTGVIDELLDRGEWMVAVNSLFSRERALMQWYGGDKESLSERIASAVKAKDFVNEDENDRTSPMRLLLENGEREVFYRIATTVPDLDPKKAYQLLHMAHFEGGEDRISDEIFATASYDLATRVLKENPDYALKIFTDLGNGAAMGMLYLGLLDDFSAKHVDTMLNIVNKMDYSKRREEISRVVVKALESPEGGDSNLGVTLYGLVKGLSLGEGETEKLYELAARSMSDWKIEESSDQKLRLHWAQNSCKHGLVRSLAYNILVEQDCDGPEVIELARQLFQLQWDRRLAKDAVSIDPIHIQKFYDQLPENNLEMRAAAARRIDDKTKLGEVACAFQVKGDLRRAYSLGVETGLSGNEVFAKSIVEPLIERELTRAEEKHHHPSGYLVDSKDKHSCVLYFDRLLDKWPATAFQVAERCNDSERMDLARDKVFEVNDNPAILMNYFAHNKDKVGYERAVSMVAEQYGVDMKDVTLLLPIKT